MLLKSIKTRFKLAGFDIFSFAKIVLLFAIPSLYLFIFIGKDNITKILCIAVSYLYYYFIFSKSYNGIENNYNALVRKIKNKYNKQEVEDIKIKKVDDYLVKVDNNYYCVSYELKGFSYTSASKKNFTSYFEKFKMYFVKNNLPIKLNIIQRSNKSDVMFDLMEINKLESKVMRTKEEELTLRKAKMKFLIEQEAKDIRKNKYNKTIVRVYSKSAKKLRENIENLRFKDLMINTADETIDFINNLKEKTKTNKNFILADVDEKLKSYYMYNTAKKLAKLDSNFNLEFSFSPIDKDTALSGLDFGHNNIGDELSNKKSDEDKTKTKKGLLVSLIEEINKDVEKLYNVSSFFSIDENINEVKSRAIITKISSSGLYYKKIEDYDTDIMKMSMYPKKMHSIVFQSEYLTRGMPNEQSILDDYSGQYMAKLSNGYHIFNPFWITETRTSYNMQLFGDMWAGKTTFLRWLGLNNWASGNKSIFYDVEKEYKDFIIALGGEYIDLYNVSFNFYELLKVNSLDEDDEKVNQERLLDATLETNITRLSSFYVDLLSINLVSEFEYTLNKYYRELLDNTYDYNKSKKANQPHYIKWLRELTESERDKEDYINDEYKIHYDRRILLLVELGALQAKGGLLFAETTTLDLNNDLIGVDFSKLFSNEDKLYTAYTKQVIQVLEWGEMSRNRDINTKKGLFRHNFMKRYDEAKFLAIIKDEDHRFLNNGNKIFLKNTDTIQRQAPKHFTGIWSATHSIDEYNIGDDEVSGLKSTILQTKTYKIIMKQKSATLPAYKKHLINDDDTQLGGLTEDIIKKSFSFDKKGQYILTYDDYTYIARLDIPDFKKHIVFLGASENG